MVRMRVFIKAGVLLVVAMLGGMLWEQTKQYLAYRAISPGQREVQRICDLYYAQLYDEVLSESDRAYREQRYSTYRPEILYIRWATEIVLNQKSNADKTQQRFLQEYPDHPLCADMRLRTAKELMEEGNPIEAEAQLIEICNRYPYSSLAETAGNLLIAIREDLDKGNN